MQKVSPSKKNKLNQISKLSNDSADQLVKELMIAEIELENLKQILNASAESILITNPSMEIIYVNPAWEKMTGFSFQEAIGKTPRILKSGKTPKSFYNQLKIHLKRKQSFSSSSLINKRKDGSEFPAHSTIFPVLRNGEVSFYVQFLYDITEEKNKEAQRQHLLSIVSHELKTPITVLKLLISRFSNPKFKRKITNEDWKTINSELDRLTELIDDSLDISKIDADKFSLQLSLFDLDLLIKEVINQISIITTNHTISYQGTPNLLIQADSKRIKQVLINLLTNALKYSQPNTTIEIQTLTEKRLVEVLVKDQGIGIAKKKQSKIFNKSFQVRNKSSEGLGLGLYISKEIIKKHRGKIWVDSILKKGSTFSFSLPLE